MTVVQELKAVQEKLAAQCEVEAGMTVAMADAKSKIETLEAKLITDGLQAKGEIDAVKAQRDSAVASSEKASAELAKIRQELEEAKGKLALAPFKDVSAGQAPVGVGAATGSDSVTDVIALVEAARGTPEYVKLYKANKAAYDAAFKKMSK